MGTLRPCKRICKSILEPCAHIIASSEILTRIFDCDIYSDSNDRNVCEDPTRRSKCYTNEFKCLDNTCIPLPWKCDNIKDCSEGEDEEQCIFCEHNEFRCPTNDECIPDKFRCDQVDDCPDGADEYDCLDDINDDDDNINDKEIERETTPYSPASRIYSFIHEQLPNSPNGRPYLKISSEDRLSSTKHLNYDHELPMFVTEETKQTFKDFEEIQQESASGRTVKHSKKFGNFQDSKEIMMTSDSEVEYKYSSTGQPQIKKVNNKMSGSSAHVSPCPDGELRCISGRCISLSQLCDKVKMLTSS